MHCKYMILIIRNDNDIKEYHKNLSNLNYDFNFVHFKCLRESQICNKIKYSANVDKFLN
jgi:hypothetical protein